MSDNEKQSERVTEREQTTTTRRERTSEPKDSDEGSLRNDPLRRGEKPPSDDDKQ